MTFPYINIKTKNFTLTPLLQETLEKRFKTLERLLPENGTDVVCDVELEKVSDHHNSGKIYRAEVNLKMGGYLLRAEATEERMENAIDEVKNELKAEMRKLNQKTDSVFKKGARKAKDMMRFGVL